MIGKVKGDFFLKNIMQFEPIYCFLNKALGKHFEYSVLASENWEELTKIWLYWFDAIEVSEQKNFLKKWNSFQQVERETTWQTSLIISAKNWLS